MLKKKPLKCRRLSLVIGKALETDILVKFVPVNADGADFVFLPLLLSGVKKILVPKKGLTIGLAVLATSL